MLLRIKHQKLDRLCIKSTKKIDYRRIVELTCGKFPGGNQRKKLKNDCVQPLNGKRREMVDMTRKAHLGVYQRLVGAWRLLAAFGLICILSVLPASAQFHTGTITGTVTDES